MLCYVMLSYVMWWDAMLCTYMYMYITCIWIRSIKTEGPLKKKKKKLRSFWSNDLGKITFTSLDFSEVLGGSICLTTFLGWGHCDLAKCMNTQKWCATCCEHAEMWQQQAEPSIENLGKCTNRHGQMTRPRHLAEIYGKQTNQQKCQETWCFLRIRHSGAYGHVGDTWHES